jgi:hypothetical protein
MTCSIVDFPEPDGPTMPTSSPYPMVSVTPESAVTPPGYDLPTSSSATTVTPAPPPPCRP